MSTKETRRARRSSEGPRNHPNDYTAAEDAILREMWATGTRAAILAALPGRPWLALQRAAARRKLPRVRRSHYEKWEGRPLEQLHARYATEGAERLAAELGFTLNCVRNKAKTEGLQYKPRLKRRPAKKAPKRTPAEEKAAREARR
jgi:hypothetical protein